MADTPLVPAYVTKLGRAYNADALTLLKHQPDNSLSLVLTSPPFALKRQKAYGNVSPTEYIDWFMPFAKEIHRVLRPEGSFVLEIGGTWTPDGTRSLYHYQLVFELSKVFHLAQEFFWYNPSRLPTPAEWVTIKRTRVKDAVSMVWWLSKTTEPRADNRQVLKPYSRSMQRLLRDGYDAKERPSQHKISTCFRKDNGGAIPPNLLELPNTRSRDSYIQLCRESGLTVHPARFPRELPDFFIRFLTEAGQTVYDPFAGSNTTGYAAESLSRRWLSSELNEEYVQGSQLRFPDAVPMTTPTKRNSAAG